MPFISFSCLIALAKTLSTMLNRSGEDEHPCRVSDPSREAFSLSPPSMVLALGFYSVEEQQVDSFLGL